MKTAARYIAFYEAFNFLIGSNFELIIGHNRLMGNILMSRSGQKLSEDAVKLKALKFY
jgi:hypothetical protein